MMATCINGITAGNLDCFYYVKISVAKREKQEGKIIFGIFKTLVHA